MLVRLSFFCLPNTSDANLINLRDLTNVVAIESGNSQAMIEKLAVEKPALPIASNTRIIRDSVRNAVALFNLSKRLCKYFLDFLTKYFTSHNKLIVISFMNCTETYPNAIEQVAVIIIDKVNTRFGPSLDIWKEI
jgi:hypothetical protein